MREFKLESDEHIVKEVRKHWFIFALELVPFALLTLIPFLIPVILSLVPPLAIYASFFDYTAPLGRAGLGMWLLFVWTAAWSAFSNYFLDLWVLTSERIIDIDQQGYFRREVSSLLLDRVQDVTTEVHGILPSLLNIGDITVQSAGAVNEFNMKNIPHPSQIRDLILEYVPEHDRKPV